MTFRWGVLGAGRIAAAMVTDLALLDDVQVVAVASRRDVGSAQRFAAEHGVARAYGSYEELVADDSVDAVYVSPIHPLHHDAALLAIQAGRATLVEKPFTMDATEARELVDAARARGVFLMEAMWARFVPHMVRVRELLAEGALGDVRLVVADHCQWFAEDPGNRLFDPTQGGGALLDLGIYPVSFASMVLGTPDGITAVSTPAFTGVDGTTSMVLSYDGGAQSVLTTTLAAAGPNRAAIVGTEARIEIDPTFYVPSAFTLTRRDGSVERWDEPRVGHGLRHEAAEVMRCVRAGRLESEVLPLDETVAIMATLDEVRRQIGLVYP
jgi:predicted dehydrogenase